MSENSRVPTATRHPRPDAVCVDAVVPARAALIEAVDPKDVGAHLGHVVEGDRLVSHLFGCERAGYGGWRWCVVVTRASRQRSVTVNEVVLLPTEDAVVAPAWVPYRERLLPGDVGRGDLLPTEDDDPRLVPGWFAGDERTSPLRDDTSVRPVVDEIGLGRVRVLSLEGRDLASQRWYDGEHGPEAEVAQGAPARCHSCGFLVRLAGPLSSVFGVCANEVSIDDGTVVSFDHGCGAHSQVMTGSAPSVEALSAPAFDTFRYDDVESL